jgi:predicted nucleotidyltransferase component of viral defense system
MLQLKTIQAETFELLQELSAVDPLSSFSLAGGTALALQLGHRTSIDLDFLTRQQFDSYAIFENLVDNFEIESYAVARNSAAMFIKYQATIVKTDFLRHNYGLLRPIIEVDGIRLYSLEDIAAMKLNAIANRGAKKDFYDIYSLLECFSLITLLDLYKEKYHQMNDLSVVKSLIYFEDAELEPDPITLLNVTWDDIKRRLVQTVPATF